MTEAKKKRNNLEAAVDIGTKFIADRQSRSFIFLVISFVVILLLNGLLPIIEGEAHYTVEAIEMSYGEYVEKKAEDNNYRLTWASEMKIELYTGEYIKANPDLTPEEVALISPPSAMPVHVYSKFFYQYVFWYISTLTSLGSAVILFYSLFNFLNIRAKENEPRYKKVSEQVDDLGETYLDPTTFEPWMENVFNKKRKIKQHIHNVKYELDKLEKKTGYQVKRKLKPYYDERLKADGDLDKANEILKTLEPLTKQDIKYIETKEKLLSLLDETYIEQYVVDGFVKHFKYIYPMYIYNGSNGTGLIVDSYSLIQSDTERIGKDAGKKIFTTLTMTVLFAVLFTITAVASAGKDPFWIFINVISKITPLLIQVPLAMDYSRNFMESHLMTNLVNRRSIGFLYLADMSTEGKVQDLERIKRNFLKGDDTTHA